ncbi:asparaginase [Lactococcus insecticola]|uniref:asparaginase n=1 Tax=Pseudolactococcus insecticola TaxID=2709158 RepID=A0A6A0B9T6_9LACT|nr:asparaginase [Lactococcus insecticola]GFH41383.1 L-asparaginase [Lactococcus insecticola]
MKNILVLHTGGTISMHEDAAGNVVPDASNQNPMNTVQNAIDNVKLTVEDVFNLPSPHVTLNDMLVLKQRINRAFDDELFDGVVITHGTDTLEETAFFLDATIKRGKPIVITGAMRSSNELGNDGVYNFLSSIRVAASADSRDRGVLVVMNDEIHSARYVTKTHTTNVSTFQTPTHGPLGLLTKTHILYFQNDLETTHFDIDNVTANVPIIKAYAGMTGDLFDLLDCGRLDGLVIEALGAGNLPPLAAHSLQRFLDADLPVVLVSRCFNGIAEPVYAYDGGGVKLHEAGVLFAREVNSQKARLKLIIALNAGLSQKNLANYIEK